MKIGDSVSPTPQWMNPNLTDRKATTIKDAARQFEALMIAELLRASRSEDSGWLGDESDGAMSNAMEMGQEFLAQALSDRGGLGLARMVEAGLEKK